MHFQKSHADIAQELPKITLKVSGERMDEVIEHAVTISG